ncbi:MAG: glycosyltransferase [Microthrixaceae bacterium]
MTVHYLVSAYHEHGHLERLCRVLRALDPTCIVTIQHDRSKALPPPDRFDGLATIHPTRAAVRWGDGSFLDELVRSMQRALSEPWDHLVVITGQDYPIRPPAEIVEHLDANGALGILWSEEIPAPSVPRDATELQRRYYFRHRWLPRAAWRLGGRSRGVGVVLRALAHAPLVGRRMYARPRPRGETMGIGVLARRGPLGPDRPCRMGPDQFVLARVLVEELVRSATEDADLLAYFRRCAIPSEAWFHTVLWPHRRALLPERLHLAEFGGGSHPRVLGPEDFAEVASSGRWFARKLDSSSARLLDRIDIELLGLPAPVATSSKVAVDDERPSVSIVIPCFGHAQFLSGAIESALAQTIPIDQIIVVDDGSPDDTAAVAAPFAKAGVECIRRPNGGLAAARNTGADACSSDYVIFLDADDRLDPEYARQTVALIGSDPNVGYVYTQCEYFGAVSGRSAYPAWTAEGLLADNFVHASALLRTSLVRRLRYDEGMRSGYEDWDLYLRLADEGIGGVLCDLPLLFYRKHGGGSMSDAFQADAHAREKLRRRIRRRHWRLWGARRQLRVELGRVRRELQMALRGRLPGVGR